MVEIPSEKSKYISYTPLSSGASAAFNAVSVPDLCASSFI